MSLLSVVQDVCAVVGIARPTSVVASINSNRTMFEMLALANEMAQRIAGNAREWNALMVPIKTGGPTVASSITGVLFSAIPLPADFNRLLLTSSVWRMSVPTLPMKFISDYNQWAERQLRGILTPSYGSYILHNGEMHIVPPLAAVDLSIPAWENSKSYTLGDRALDTAENTTWSANINHISYPTGTFAEARAAVPASWSAADTSDKVAFIYLSKNCVGLSSGGRGDTFLHDDDTFVLPERLLKLGMIWQWKGQKGSPYAEDMATYQDALMVAAGADKPAPTLIGRVPISVAAQVALPWPADWGPQ